MERDHFTRIKALWQEYGDLALRQGECLKYEDLEGLHRVLDCKERVIEELKGLYAALERSQMKVPAEGTSSGAENLEEEIRDLVRKAREAEEASMARAEELRLRIVRGLKELERAREALTAYVGGNLAVRGAFLDKSR